MVKKRKNNLSKTMSDVRKRKKLSKKERAVLSGALDEARRKKKKRK